MKEIIKKLRERKHLTQSALARLLGVERSTVNNWEQGVGKPSRDLLLPLAKVLGTTTDFLLESDKAA